MINLDVSDEDRYKVALEDLACSVPIIRKAALYRIVYMDYGLFYDLFCKYNISKLMSEYDSETQHILMQKLTKKLKVKSRSEVEKSEAREETNFWEKTPQEIINDWAAADIRIKLAILGGYHQLNEECKRILVETAKNDNNPVINLELENLISSKHTCSEEESRKRLQLAHELIKRLRNGIEYKSTGKPLNELNVLVVDDSRVMRSLLKKMLKEVKNLHTADTAKDAMHYMIREKFDLVFLDISLPDEDGLVLMRNLKDRGHKNAFVVCSSLDDQNIIKTAFACGATDYVIKSDLSDRIKLDELLERI